MKTTRYVVSNSGDFSEFFVHEGQETPYVDGRVRHFATWCSVSAYGVFGHYWHSMGRPFAEFIQDIGHDYLFGKITTKKKDEQAMHFVKKVWPLFCEVVKAEKVLT